MIQPDMLTMRITRPVARAMAPTVISDWVHSHSARPVVLTISRPLRLVMTTSMLVTTRAASWVFSVCSLIASRAYCCSKSVWAKSFRVAMLVYPSTMRPMSLERASEEMTARALTRGTK
ncbi:hypothetical protein D3C80_1662800 [compost metagenome]